MARIEITEIFGTLWSWPGNLFNATGDSRVVTRNAGQFTYRLGESSGFENYEISVSGRGFRYEDGYGTEGRISHIVLSNEKGQKLVTFSDFAAKGAAGDFGEFWLNMFGAQTKDAGPGPNVKTTWTMLMSGRDTIIGSAGNDWKALVGLDAGRDTYQMGAGDDEVAGGIGNDSYDGGAGRDLIGFRETHFNEGDAMIRGARADLTRGIVHDPWGGKDKVAGFEDLGGSRLNDRLTGDADPRGNAFSGYRGHDRIDGGADSFDAQGRKLADTEDWLRYEDDYWLGGNRGILVNLETGLQGGSIQGRVRDTFGHSDRVSDIEHVSGTRFGDTFKGSRLDNTFVGGEGRDRFDGGQGFDRVDFSQQFTADQRGGIIVDLSRASGHVQNDGFGHVEDAWGIEAVIGTHNGDRIKGTAAAEEFTGGLGNDTLTGGAGQDRFIWNWDAETGASDVITDFRSGEDLLVFDVSGFWGMGASVRLLSGWNMTDGDGTFIFDAGQHMLYWDPDGIGDTGARVVARLDGVSQITAADFLLLG